MLVSRGEVFEAVWYRRLENSNEYSSSPSGKFKCKVAGQKDISTFQVNSGLITEQKGMYLYATRCPLEIRPDDKIVFMEKTYIVETVGEYISNARFLFGGINYGTMQKSFPKGIKIV